MRSATQLLRAVTLAVPSAVLIVSCGSQVPTVSMRPVLGVFDESPALVDPAGDHPPGLSADTGLSEGDDPTVAAYLASASDPAIIYHLGPAVVVGADFEGSEDPYRQEAGSRTHWVVKPQFTVDGAEKFRRASMALATEPVGSPTRQIAIVVDGLVVSAPALAADVDPLVGLEADVLVISVDSQQVAEELAAGLSD